MDTARLKRLANSQLEHVLIAIRDGDKGYNVRDVLDPWWCFERGPPFVREGRDRTYRAIQFNNPCGWARRDVLPSFDWLSKGAEAILDLGKSAQIVDRKSHPSHLRLIIDHSVPISYICTALWKREWTTDTLSEFLLNNFKRAVISYSENQALNERKLGATMPLGWNFGDDPFERYREAGIQRA